MFTKKHVVLVVMLVLILFSCEESLPTREDPIIKLEVSLRVLGENPETYPGTQWFLDRFFIPQDIVFVFSILSHFDEVLQAGYFFKGSVEIFVLNKPQLAKYLEFTFENPEENATIVPEMPYNVGVGWDHKFDDGSFLWDYYAGEEDAGFPVTIPLKVKGEIQVFKRFQKLETNEVEFLLTYKGRISDRAK